MFEQAFEKFLSDQREGASGRRLEMLNSDLTGTKKLLEVAVWPILRSFEGIVLEYEVANASGVIIYIDAFFVPLSAALECEGFASHAEKVTRSRFDFERTRVRMLGTRGIVHMPFTKDQLDKQPELCRQSMYELMGKHSSIAGTRGIRELSVFEREVIRYGLHLQRPLRLEDVKYCLQCKYDLAKKTLTQLTSKGIIAPVGSGTKRYHEYCLLDQAGEILAKVY